MANAKQHRQYLVDNYANTPMAEMVAHTGLSERQITNHVKYLRSTGAEIPARNMTPPAPEGEQRMRRHGGKLKPFKKVGDKWLLVSETPNKKWSKADVQWLMEHYKTATKEEMVLRFNVSIGVLADRVSSFRKQGYAIPVRGRISQDGDQKLIANKRGVPEKYIRVKGKFVRQRTRNREWTKEDAEWLVANWTTQPREQSAEHFGVRLPALLHQVCKLRREGYQIPKRPVYPVDKPRVAPKPRSIVQPKPHNKAVRAKELSAKTQAAAHRKARQEKIEASSYQTRVVDLSKRQRVYIPHLRAMVYADASADPAEVIRKYTSTSPLASVRAGKY